MSNREKRKYNKSVNIYLALSRISHGQSGRCIRTVEKGIDNELEILESKLNIIGGYWRIHKTVNERDVEKARKWLMAKLIYYPEKASYIDSEWRTALLQRECIYGQKKFMLDIDTENLKILDEIYHRIIMRDGKILKIIKTPKGYHYITMPFDTREVCKLEDVTLLRDGFYFIKEVGEK